MPLVDYASDASSDSPDPPPKRRKTTPQAALPALPAAFHDLYASTVRTAAADDPALHQGRRRQHPHVPGRWPSHLYVEWHPPAHAHRHLTALVDALQSRLSDAAGAVSAAPDTAPVTSLLANDLGVPLPLHVSLSRPLNLPTAAKETFLEDVTAAVRRSAVRPFSLHGASVEWHRTAESQRAFLVLRVRSNPQPPERAPAGAKTGEVNPELTELLRRCNGAAQRAGQAQLYQWAEQTGATVTDKQSESTHPKEVGHAFHVSIAWTFAQLTDVLLDATEAVFSDPQALEQIRALAIQVDGVKAKIGNVVTHIALLEPGRVAKKVRGALGLT